MNQLEELFNERLANHSIPPPAGGWERVAANLSKKNKTVVWMRWAAVLVVGMFAIGVIATRQSSQVDTLTQTRKTPLPDRLEKQKENGATKETQAVASVSSTEKKTGKKPVRKKRAEVREDQSVAVVTDVETTSVPEMVAVDANVSAEQPVIEPTKESKVAARAIVLTYTLDPVVPVATKDQATDTEQKSSSLGKVVKFARDVKNGDSPIGLKIVKEDLFAHSKKKSPTKTH